MKHDALAAPDEYIGEYLTEGLALRDGVKVALAPGAGAGDKIGLAEYGGLAENGTCHVGIVIKGKGPDNGRRRTPIGGQMLASLIRVFVSITPTIVLNTSSNSSVCRVEYRPAPATNKSVMRVSAFSCFLVEPVIWLSWISSIRVWNVVMAVGLPNFSRYQDEGGYTAVSYNRRVNITDHGYVGDYSNCAIPTEPARSPRGKAVR